MTIDRAFVRIVPSQCGHTVCVVDKDGSPTENCHGKTPKIHTCDMTCNYEKGECNPEPVQKAGTNFELFTAQKVSHCKLNPFFFFSIQNSSMYKSERTKKKIEGANMRFF